MDTVAVATATSNCQVGRHLSLLLHQYLYVTNLNRPSRIMEEGVIDLYTEIERVVKSAYTVDLSVRIRASPTCMSYVHHSVRVDLA